MNTIACSSKLSGLGKEIGGLIIWFSQSEYSKYPVLESILTPLELKLEADLA